jgi:hypothetical protein
MQTDPLSPDFVFRLSVLATTGLVLCWVAFWVAVIVRKENVHQILVSASFFRTVAVMGVIAATVVLSLAGRLEGNITGAILRSRARNAYLITQHFGEYFTRLDSLSPMVFRQGPLQRCQSFWPAMKFRF